MPIPAIVTKLADAPEAFRGEYKKITLDDGTDVFKLDVTPVNNFELDDVSGLKSALGKERKKNREFEERIEAFKDLDPKAAKAALKQVEEWKSSDPEAKMKAQVEAREKALIEKHTGEIAEKDKTLTRYRDAVEKSLISDALSAAIAKAEGNELFLKPHLAARVRLEERDGKFHHVVLDENGAPAVGDGRGNPMSIDQLVDSFRKQPQWAAAFKNGATGGGSRPGTGESGKPGSGAGTRQNPLRIKRSDQEAIRANFDKIGKMEAIIVDDDD